MMRLFRSRQAVWLVISSLIILSLNSFSPTLASGTVLGDLANSMQPGTFKTLQTNGFSNGAILAPSGPSNFITMFSDSAEWDPKYKTVHFIGASHDNSLTTYVRYADSTNSWATIPTPIPNGTLHGYDHNAVNTTTGDFFHRPFNNSTIHKFSPSNGTWSQFSLPESNFQITGGLEFFPEMNSLVYVDSHIGVWTRHLGTGSWTKRSNALPMGSYHTFIEYNPVHKVVIFGGGQNNKTVYKMDSGGSITRMGDAPVGLGVGTDESRVSVDPVSGDYIVLKSDRKMYAYNVVKDQWTTLGVTYPSGNPAWGTIEASIATYGVIMFIHYDFSNSAVYLYKHSSGGGGGGGDTIPPAAPQNLNLTVQ